jgi:hypothetical protein
MNVIRLIVGAGLALAAAAAPAAAADLQPETAAAFARYAVLTEARLDAETGPRYLWVDALPEPRRRDALAALRRGELVIESMTTRDRGREVDVPDGLIHHWLGVVFVPGATVDSAVALLQDYDRHADIYAPTVAASKLRSRTGDTFHVHLRFMMKKVITVVTNTESDARFTRDGSDRVQSRIRSTRIAEVEDPGTPREREKPVGHDGGYLWRLNSYWRFLERDGGVYIQCESITLTRGIPTGFGWMVRPFVTSIPRESLTFTLERTRARLARRERS